MRFIFAILFVIGFIQPVYSIDGILINTTDYSFKEKWSNTLSESVPRFITCDTVYKKQYFFIAPNVNEYELDSNQTANVTYSIKIKKPDHSIYFEHDSMELINAKISNPDNLQLAKSVLQICFENDDPFGTYSINVIITDQISHKSKKIESEMTLVKLPEYEQFKVIDENDFNVWTANYYEHPKPERALSYYIYYSQSKLSENENGFWPVFSLFNEIVKKNNYLLPQIIDCYKSHDLRTKIYLLYLLVYSHIEADDFFSKLQGDEKETYQKIKDSPMPDFYYGSISEPSQLDMLWGTFFASGSYKPIQKLISTLDYVQYEGDLEKYKTSEKTEDDKQKAIKSTIYKALVWSMKSNCKQHDLVLSYCRWAYQNENLSDLQKNELKKIIEE